MVVRLFEHARGYLLVFQPPLIFVVALTALRSVALGWV